MNINSFNLKIIVGVTYLVIFLIGLYFLFSSVDFKDLTNYDFIRSNKDIIFKYKNENFFFLAIIFFIFSIIWILFLGFVLPLLIFSGFVFGKWWGTIIAVTGITIGATLLYILANFCFTIFVYVSFCCCKALLNVDTKLALYKFIYYLFIYPDSRNAIINEPNIESRT